ncbi:non-hydrolyzing UDP-N-acetylglucosamine 2-epimerase [Schaedlerella arabinosiphila]|uniref:non-hydrolyzing UDP-N-acetylglucosamine 2-epimerase n=1 Tax=Schaedlerella arabinosiphila TaxID=2044587 RepID=UPI002557F770|nr:UDP-N-acetylglucosamine 2-epimerase (non-hydrolyzing) [Schaedlerella arabinosiphila]
MKLVTIVGARPQFIKAAAVSRVLRRQHQEFLVHTGQHYDENMSEVFFEELHIPRPDQNLGVGSGSHAKQTANMMIGIEEILLEEKPDGLLIYGDTNSTLAGALAASKIHIPVFHIEAGLRSYNKRMPEEQNRILADHSSDLLFCPTETAVENLKREGITKGVYQVGDVMCDAVKYYAEQIEKQDKSYYFNQLRGLFCEVIPSEKWYIATIHRAENTENIQKIREILEAFEELDAPVLFPVHPRTKGIVTQLYQQYNYQNILFIEPVGYSMMLYLVKHALKTITDSGGLQKETYLLDTPCITVREQTEWVETLSGNYNILANPEKNDILSKIFDTRISPEKKLNYYGDGHSSEKICALLSSASN